MAALLIVAYLGIQALAQRGEVVTVTFDRAGEAQPGDTKVLYQGAVAGHLIDILPNKDGRRIDFKLRMVPAAKRGLTTNARFWLIGATPNLDINSLKAVVEGVAVGFAPNETGTPTRTFEGLDTAPQVLPGDRGTRYVLYAHALGPIQVGSEVLFRGQSIGKVMDVKFNGTAGFRLDVLIFQPYDALVKPGDLFWKSSPVRLSFAGGGVDANLAPAATILSGGIDLEIPSGNEGAPQSAAGAEFTLYRSENAARQNMAGPGVRYDLRFPAAAGDLAEGAEVTLLGFQVGEVERVRLAYDPRSGLPFTAVTALLYPKELDPAASMPADAPDMRQAADATLRKLIGFGYRARLKQTPALVGARSIALVLVSGAPRAELAFDGPNPRIPSAPGATDLDDITAKTDQLLAKVNGIPIEAIGADLHVITSRLRSVVTSPKLDTSIAHLASTLAEVDQSLAQVQPQIGPLMTKLNQAADQIVGVAAAARQLLAGQGDGQDGGLPEAIGQLNEAARSIRSLADFLDRHPEALIRGKRPDR